MNDFRDQVIRVHDTDKMPILLVGNKADMESEREVTKEEAQALARDWGVQYLETSAKTRVNVDEVRWKGLR